MLALKSVLTIAIIAYLIIHDKYITNWRTRVMATAYISKVHEFNPDIMKWDIGMERAETFFETNDTNRL